MKDQKMNRGTQSSGEPWSKVRSEQGYTVYGVSQIHKNTLSEAEKHPPYHTAIYDEAVTFLDIRVRKQ